MTSTFLSLLLLVVIPYASAFPTFLQLIPNGNAAERPDSGITCLHLGHTPCEPGAPRNPFGLDFNKSREWTVEFCQTDSDGDGLTNGEELGDPCCVWKPGQTPLRTNSLSHPGDPNETNTAPKCDEIQPTTTPSPQAASVNPSPSIAPTPLAASASPSASWSVKPGPSQVPDVSDVTDQPDPSPENPPLNPSVSLAPDSTDTDPSSSTDPDAGTGDGTGTGDSTGTSTGPSTDDDSDSDNDTGSNGQTDTSSNNPSPSMTPEPSQESTATISPTASPVSPSPASSSDDNVCFPSHATVEIESGAHVTMRDLRVGDRVLVGNGRYSEVFMFSHKIQNVKHEFVTIEGKTKNLNKVVLSLTKGHFLYVNGKPAAASTVQIGDSLETQHGFATVTKTKSEMLRGLYNPQTLDGDIVVNGVRASTYTHSVKHMTAHCMLMPVRAWFRLFGMSTSIFHNGADSIANILPSEL